MTFLAMTTLIIWATLGAWMLLDRIFGDDRQHIEITLIQAKENEDESR